MSVSRPSVPSRRRTLNPPPLVTLTVTRPAWSRSTGTTGRQRYLSQGRSMEGTISNYKAHRPKLLRLKFDPFYRFLYQGLCNIVNYNYVLNFYAFFCAYWIVNIIIIFVYFYLCIPHPHLSSEKTAIQVYIMIKKNCTMYMPHDINCTAAQNYTLRPYNNY